MVDVLLLEPSTPTTRTESKASAASGTPAKEALPLYAPISAPDARVATVAKLIDNEAARFIRALIVRAWRLAPPEAAMGLALGPVPPLPIVLVKGGNFARVGLRWKEGSRVLEFAQMPYILLDMTADRMSQTLLHEGGHVVHTIAWRGRRLEAPWTPLPHSTFAVTDPCTALAEGYAISLEALWGHFGSDATRRAFYDRVSPRFGVQAGAGAAFFEPVHDLWSYSQNWARYQGIRDGLAAFCGFLHSGAYLRSQLDPARDRSQLKPAGAMVASEGVVASILFWTATREAVAAGARARGGLDQPAIAKSQDLIVKALVQSGTRADAKVPYRPDVIDVVSSCGTPDSRERERAMECFLDLTRGVTVRPKFRRLWKDLYDASVVLDQTRVKQLLDTLDAERKALMLGIDKEGTILRQAVGPVLPVRVSRVTLELPGLAARFPLEFDLNAMAEPELAMLPDMDAAAAARVLAERDAKPFVSLQDFEHRTGYSSENLGLAEIR